MYMALRLQVQINTTLEVHVLLQLWITYTDGGLFVKFRSIDCAILRHGLPESNNLEQQNRVWPLNEEYFTEMIRS